jgi:hypothetical protein
METIIVLGLLLALLVIISIDAQQKKRKYLNGGK